MTPMADLTSPPGSYGVFLAGPSATGDLEGVTIQPRLKIMRLLNIESSPRGSRSASIAVTSAFVEAYRQACPGVMVDTLNVWEEKLPDFDQEAIGAKYKGVYKQPMDAAETAVWEKIQELAARFQQADRIVLGVPMWNFAIPQLSYAGVPHTKAVFSELIKSLS